MRTCERCDRRHHAKGLCAEHYRREHWREWPSNQPRTEGRRRQRARFQQRMQDVATGFLEGLPIAEVAARAGFPSLGAAEKYFRDYGVTELSRRFDRANRERAAEIRRKGKVSGDVSRGIVREEGRIPARLRR